MASPLPLDQSWHSSRHLFGVEPKRLDLRVPSHCAYCNCQSTVKLEQTVKGGAVVLTWCCTQCSESWPITDADRHE